MPPRAEGLDDPVGPESLPAGEAHPDESYQRGLGSSESLSSRLFLVGQGRSGFSS